MQSRAELRILIERALRSLLIVALAVMLWQSLRETTFDYHAMGTLGIVDALRESSASPTAPPRIDVQLDSVPSVPQRAWLGALAGAGSSVAWSGDLPPVMTGAHPTALPTGGTRITVAAPSGSSL